MNVVVFGESFILQYGPTLLIWNMKKVFEIYARFYTFNRKLISSSVGKLVVKHADTINSFLVPFQYP